jgi:hypothetical protein
MTTQQTSSPGDAAVPIACSLGTAGLTAQAARWERLAATAMTARSNTAEGVRLSFRPGRATEDELRALTAVENECCPWATWTVQASGGGLVLDVRSSGDGIATLHALFRGQAAQAQAPARARD